MFGVKIMINVSLGEIINAFPFLNKISNNSFVGKDAFKIGRLVREITKEYELFEKSRKEIIEQYAERDSENNIIIEDNNVKIPLHLRDECNAKLEELLNERVDVNIEKLSFNILNNIEFTPIEALSAEVFFE